MPPFVNTECTNCKKPNRFDLAELRKDDNHFVKDILYRGDEKPAEEFSVACQHCGRRFKLTMKGEDDGTKK